MTAESPNPRKAAPSNAAPPRELDADVAVVGGGPGGTATAIALRRAGRSVLLLESEPFPRFHVGESLLPMSNFLFQELGILPAVVTAGFQEKRGATFLDAEGEHEVVYDFGELTDIAPIPTYQALRSELDALLLDQARVAGARIVQARATSFASDPTGAMLGYKATDGSSREARVGAVVDASGRSGFLARKLGLRTTDGELQKAALYAHFTGVPRPTGRRAGDIRIVSVRELGWLWIIPLVGGIDSVGLVLDLDEYKNLPEGSPAEKFARYIETVPAAKRLLSPARRTSEVHVESSFSYSASRYAGDRWVLVGDAGSFIDPVFSSGVLMALLSGRDAAAAIDRGLRGTELQAAGLLDYDRRMRERHRFVRRFVLAFYRKGMRDLFFAPRPGLGMMKAVATVLAGGFDPGFLDRRRMDLFYGLAKMQRYVPLVPRLHTEV